MLWLRNRRQASNLRLLDLSPGALSLLSYSAFGFVFGAIIHNERPIEIGVTNRIRTGTNAFTGRDASCYIMITIKWSPGSDSHRRLRVYETRPVASEARGL